MNLKKLQLLVSVGSLALAGAAQAQNISLYTPDQSLDEAISTFDNDAGVTVDGDVNSLPYTTATSAPDGTVVNVVTPTYSGSSLGVTFNQSTPDNKSTSSGEGTIFFTDAISYSISGNLTIAGGAHSGGELSAFLLDTTTSTYVYQYDQVMGGNGTLTAALDTSGGPLSGALTATDIYEFDAFDALQKEGLQHLNGTTTLAVTAVPEPSTWTLMFVGAGVFAGYFARKSKALMPA